jgi:tetratricopeptide (TPR) repeat protein
LPFAETDWGAALLAQGKPDAAIEKLSAANDKAPRYADALEVWGEALIAKQDWDGAVAKFHAADRLTPRWGRNHLRWGEALLFLGQVKEARKQFELANTLDLSARDRAALDVFLDRTQGGVLRGRHV